MLVDLHGYDPRMVNSVLDSLKAEHASGGALKNVDPQAFPPEYRDIAKSALDIGGQTLDAANGKGYLPTGPNAHTDDNVGGREALPLFRRKAARNPARSACRQTWLFIWRVISEASFGRN